MQCSSDIETLPLDVCEQILSYLAGADIFNAAETYENFHHVVRRRRKFDFSVCFHMKEEDFHKVLRASKENIMHFNVNHCYWLTMKSLTLVMMLPKLKELHLIDCNISTLMKKKALPAGLHALSFTWHPSYAKVLLDAEYASGLFGSLKELTVHVYPTKDISYLTHLNRHVLNYCSQLQILKLSEAVCTKSYVQKPSDWERPPIRNNDLIDATISLPKLEKLYIDFGISECFCFKEDALCWLNILLKDRTSLRDMDLGMLSMSTTTKGTTFTISVTDGSVTNLLEFLIRNSPKCKKLSMNFNNCIGIEESAQLIAESFPSMKEFSLRGCTVGINDISKLLTLFMNSCPNLVVLDLTVLATDYEANFFQLIAQFKELKILRVSTFYANKASFEEKSTEISELMSKSALWITTQSCKKVEEFEISDMDHCLNHDDMVVSEIFLACICKWTNLKKLRLCGVPTFGRGKFLPCITKNCPKLETLNLSQICRTGACNYMPNLIECLHYATNIKDLSVDQDTTLSLNLCKSLFKCTKLQRILFCRIEINASDCGHTVNLLTRLQKLIGVFFVTKMTTAVTEKSIKRALMQLKRERHSLVYSVGNQEVKVKDIPAIHADFLLRSTESGNGIVIY